MRVGGLEGVAVAGRARPFRSLGVGADLLAFAAGWLGWAKTGAMRVGGLEGVATAAGARPFSRLAVDKLLTFAAGWLRCAAASSEKGLGLVRVGRASFARGRRFFEVPFVAFQVASAICLEYTTTTSTSR